MVNQENNENQRDLSNQSNQSNQENHLGSPQNPYDLIISGAGPAGLTAGIIGGRHRLNVLVCEKAERAGPFPRGETLHNARIFSEVLGDNVLNLIATHLTTARKFNSPNAENSLEIYRRSPSIVYSWDRFIELLLSRINETSTKIRCNTEVDSSIIENNICKGVRLKSGELIYGKSVMVAEGHTSKIGKALNFPYAAINCPAVKRLIANFNEDYMGFEYFFLVPGSLDYAPRFPPGIIFVFPRGNGNCEVGLMIFTDMAQNLTS
ncbi:MAG: NAD(P)/FAD-dependent oxidoreductase, partial [Promethearchaeota archaeon]